MHRPAVVALAVGLAVGLAVTACDGDDDAPQVAEADVPFCDAYGALLVGPLADAATDAGDPAVLRVAVEATDELLGSLVAAAPSEIEDAVTALAADYDGTFAVLERYGFDLDRVGAEATSEEQEVLDTFGATPAGPGASDPFAQLQRFVAEHCAPDVTLPPDLLESPTTSPTTTPTSSPTTSP